MGHVKELNFYTSQCVYVHFIVEKDGSLSNITFSDETSKKMKKTVTRALKKCEKWAPGTVDGKPVRVSYTLPIIIKIG